MKGGHMNKKEFKAMMALYGDNLEALSEFLGVSPSTLSKKINERSGIGFTQPEIIKIKDRYQLSADQIDSIFFTHEVS
jgi:plasmid maintenance system antidote protein VapI